MSLGLSGGAERPGPDKVAGAKQPLVLVVDDDQSVRNVVERTLKVAGYDTRTAECGRAGIAAYEREHGELAAVLLDFTMPDMGGAEVFEQMRRVNQNVPVILMSGYSEPDATLRFTGRGLAGFLEKPFAPQVLYALLRLAIGPR